jgi:phytoene/squalene synthetase
MNLFDEISLKCSKITTHSYSTSFTLGILSLNKKYRNPIYAIYGFVRFADEIVDSFHDYDKETLLNNFTAETYKAIEQKISLNPILNSFQLAVNVYKFDKELIECFLHSMQMDLNPSKEYTQEKYKEYILGSAEVVGLMCLRVFCEGNNEMYQGLKPSAMKLGSAFQKINFLRDLKADYYTLGRAYFPSFNLSQFDVKSKSDIEADIEIDFKEGYQGIKKLPKGSRLGVYVAYIYYYSLFNKIKKLPPNEILENRIRISDSRKYLLIGISYVRHVFNLL